MYCHLFLCHKVIQDRKGSPSTVVKLSLCDHKVMDSLEIASYRNVGKYCVHKTQSGWTIP
jgi:hypothetical protein